MVWEVEHIGACTLYRGDCAQILPDLPEVDHLVTDPPWEVSGTQPPRALPHLGPRRDLSKGLAKDSLGRWQLALLCACVDRCRGDAFIVSGFRELGPLITGLAYYRGTFGWHKPNGCPAFLFPARLDLAFIVWAAKKSALYGYQHWPSMVFRAAVPQAGCLASERYVDASGKAIHPAQGPLLLYRALLRPLPRGVCLDPFMGTGTTGVACVEQGRGFIGIELDQRYFDLACQRIERAEAQADLFVPQPSLPTQLTMEMP